MKITVIRHGRPATDFATRITGRHFSAWLTAYGETGIDPTLLPSARLTRTLADCVRLFSSPTKRARESAALLGLRVNHHILVDAIEAPLPNRIPCALSFRPATFIVLARACWLLGLASATETKREVRIRAQRLAHQLATLAETNSHVALVGHGYMNRVLAQSLAASGWRRSGPHRHDYWSHACFERA